MKQSERNTFVEAYVEALATYFNVPQQGLHGQALLNFVVTEVLLRKDETSVEMIHIMREATE